MEDNTENQVYEFDLIPYKRMYYNENYGIYKFITNVPIPWCEQLNDTSYMGTIAGSMPELVQDITYRVRAKIIYNKKYNSYQYTIITITQNIPKTEEQQRRFIESIFTPKQAATVLSVYPNIVDDVINGNDNVNTHKLKGIGNITWSKLKNKILSTFVLSDIISLLAPAGVTFKTISKLASETKNLALLKKELIENPYILTHIKGLGFKRVDALALKINPDIKHTKQRAIACINFILKNIGYNDGHTWLTIDCLKNNFLEFVPECEEYFAHIMKDGENAKNGILVLEHSGNKIVCLLSNYNAELYIYNHLKQFNVSHLKVPEDIIEQGIHFANEDQGFNYDEDQIAAIKKIINGSSVQIIAGRAGTSKTVISKAILDIYSCAGYNVCCMALSAKAAIRITEATGYPANTIHKALGASDLDTFFYNSGNKLPSDIILVDECSMIDVTLFKSLLSAIKPGAKIILVGDHKQLPAIGYGNVFGDLININDQNVLTVNILTKIYRTAENSGILIDANTIRDNKSPLIKMVGNTTHGEKKDMRYCFYDDKSALFNSLVSDYLKAISENGTDNVMALIPRKDNCINSTFHFNTTIQDTLLANNKSILIGKRKFNLGCKVIHKVNNYDLNVMNGEIGYITMLYDDGCEIEYGNNKVVCYDKEDMKELDYAYALTIHSAQGNEFDVVLGAIDKSHYTLLDSTLLYTLITRAKKQCTLYSDRFAFSHCIRTSKAINKQTFLSVPELLQQDVVWGLEAINE